MDDELTHELENIWKLKQLDTAPKQQKVDMNSEDMLMQLLVSHAVIDAKEYPILSFEDYEQLKQHHTKLKNRIQHAIAKLQVDKKIQETSHSLSNLSSNKNRESVMILWNEAVQADKKVKQLSQQLDQLKAEEIEAQYRILQHTAGILCLGLQKLEKKTSSGVHTDDIKTQQKIQQLQSELETITHALKSILLNYKIQPITHSPTHLLSILETQVHAQSQQIGLADERHHVDITNQKKLEFQLRVAQETSRDLQQQQALDTTMQHELQKEYDQIAQLKSTIAEMEIKASQLQSQSTVLQDREKSLKAEMEQYRDQVFQLRIEKEKLERTTKRHSLLSDSGNVEARYEQQSEEQAQEYQGQLREQAAYLEKITHQYEGLRQEHDQLTATCRDLEHLIREKQKLLDARDLQLQQLEADLQQAKKPSPSLHHAADQESLQQLQAIFSEKEAAWIEQSAAMEANYEGILREFDRLTGSAVEFETDKSNYERRIEQLTQEVKELEATLTEEKTKHLGYGQDTATTATLRKEFRKMINEMKADHERTLAREAEEKKRLEKQLKDLKHERDMSRYERINKGVQTLFMA
ncbi:hypothetical protein CU098_004690 [Rhizopus stolonifer]|uniref:Up-regulated during septation protein 1 domain-containing protein n=1 Tax=Rhizopus stolonifer TaxID=4846 RepID=A0A367KYG1_RHIST|nr:hypothetical protein CU098_004690 [Rhizopus stolonifer]